MRLEIFLVIILICVAGLIYYRDGGFTELPSFSSVVSWGVSEDEPKTTKVGSSVDNVSRSSTPTPVPATVAAPRTEEEERVADEVYNELEELPEETRVDAIHSPVSPYQGQVALKVGNVKETDPAREYLILEVNDAVEPITISGWSLESYVTNSRASLPEGAALLADDNDRTADPIRLAAGERAYVLTGETPLRTSFRENLCTGYLVEYGSFYPSLSKQCPLPSDELLQYGSVSASDDECFEFVADIRRCEIVDRDERDDADLSSRCESFVRNVLDYEGCVAKHKSEPTFFGTTWRVYLDRDRELWRSTRDVIRLLDADGKVVAVLEYK